jgi:subtilisin family serine protease
MKVRKITIFILLIAFIVLLFLVPGNLYADIKIAVIDSGSKEQVYKSISFSTIPPNIDPVGHGTKIVKLIKDINPRAKIHMLQVCEKTDFGYIPSKRSVLEAIRWCKQNDIDIVNLSLVLDYNKEIELAIKDAYYSKGIIFVAAAGNKTFFNQFTVSSNGYVYLSEKDKGSLFPASCSYVISVGAKESNGRIADYSTADVDIFSRGDYGKYRGTSFACARVTGEISNILLENQNISLDKLKYLLATKKISD